MASILNIETATSVCSVSLSVNGKVKSIRETHEPNSHASKLTIFANEVLDESGLIFKQLDAIAVSMGPGSYTGLRIGVSVAKGFCYSVDKPLIAISTLQAMAAGIAQKHNISDDDIICPMIDARRMEVYSAFYNNSLKEIREIKAEVIDENSFSETLKNNSIYFGGDGAGKCEETLSKYENAKFINGFFNSSAFMATLAEEKFNKEQFENVAYFEPYYLKDFVAGKPRVKGLRD